MKIGKIVLALAISFMCLGQVALRAGDWPTYAHDPQRSGWATSEDTLNTKNVSGLQLLWKVKVKNEPKSLTALTAPVVAGGVTTPEGVRTVVYVAGSSDNVHAIDAKTGKVIWNRTFESAVLPKYPGMWLCPNNLNATPTVDESRGLLYLIATDGTFYGLDLGTGEIKVGPVSLVPPYSKNWSLNLWNGVVYTTISQGCGGARSGIYSIDVRRPNRPVIDDLLVSKNGSNGIWDRAGVAIGENGRIFASTGDGIFNPTDGEYGSSIIAANSGGLGVADYYSPLNNRQVTSYDLDMAASGPTWIPYRNYDLVAAGGKEGVLYLLDANDLGTQDHQTPLYRQKLANDQLHFESKGIWGEPSTWRDLKGTTWLYVPIWGLTSKEAPAFPITHGPHPHGSIMAFKVVTDPATKRPTLQPAWISGDFDVPEPVAIANGVVFALSTGENTEQATATTGDIHEKWKIMTDQQRAEHTHNAVLYALDAKTGKILYQSGDSITTWVHFSGLAIADGYVYAVDHDSNVYCFGLKDEKP